MRRVALMYVLLLLVLGAILTFSLRRARPDEPPIPSTYVSAPAGYRALYLFLEEEGFPVRRWTDTLLDLDDESPGSVLVLTSPASSPIEEGEAARVKAWVGAGNTLIFLSGEGDPDPVRIPGETEVSLRRVFDLAFDSPEHARPGTRARILGDHAGGEHYLPNRVPCPETAGVESLSAGNSLETSLRAPGAVPFFGVEGERATYRIKVGRGFVYLFPSTRFFSNGAIAKGDNLALFVNLVDLRLAGGELLFDEFHHGLARPGGVILLRMKGARPAALFAAILFLAFVFARSRRFGQPVPLEPDPRRRGIEYVEALATLFRKGGKAGYILGALVDSFRRRAASGAGLGPGAPDEELLARLRVLVPGKEGEIERILRAGEVRQSGGRLLLRTARAIRDLEEAMHVWRKA